MKLNLCQPKIAYMIGFIMSDGNLYKQSGNKGKMSIEIQKQDAHILKEMASLVDCNYSIRERTRNTNFKENYTTTSLKICDLGFRNELIRVGVPEGKKFDICDIPKVYYSEIDFWRGIIDGDGSLGITSQNIPFISLITNSENLANSYIKFLEKYIGKKKTSTRNNRDKNFNIMITKEDAQFLVKILYYDDCICLERKLQKSKEVLDWERPSEMKKIDFEKKNWDKEEDNYILSHTVEESVKKLNRTAQSIKMRRWRIK